MAAHLPRLPALLFVFLAVHVASTHGDPALLPSTYDVSMCESLSCGGVEIRYTFYLANATEATADHSGNYSCGYTDLKISCKLEGATETPVITLGGDEYAVEDISYSYDQHTISLVDSDVLLGGGGDCPAVRHDVSFDETWLNDSSSNGNLTFFFGCEPRDPVALEFGAYKIKCAGFRSPPGVRGGDAFVLMSDAPELARNCSKVVSVPVRGDLLKAASSNQSNFTSGGYGDVLKRGFVLEWSPLLADGCQRCEASFGQCAYSQQKKREFMGCLCYGGKVGNPDCDNIVPAASNATASRARPRKCS